MREWKMRYEHNCRGRKCRSKLYGTPNQDYIEKILSYVELENAGVDFMASMTRSGNAKVHRTAYINIQIKKSPQKGRGYGQVTYLNFYPPLKDGGGSQLEKRKYVHEKCRSRSHGLYDYDVMLSNIETHHHAKSS